MQYKHPRIYRPLLAAAILGAVLSACASAALTPTIAPPVEQPVLLTLAPIIPTSTGTPPEGQLVFPTLTSADPAEAAPGGTIIIIGSGGYVIIPGGYNESSRSFALTWDGEPAGDLWCYINHCESQFTIPADALPGQHTISVVGGSSLPFTVLAP